MYSKPQRDEKVLVQHFRVTAVVLGLWPLPSGWDQTCVSLSTKHSGACPGVLMSSTCNPFWGNEFHTFIFAGYCEFLFIQRPTEINTILK